MEILIPKTLNDLNDILGQNKLYSNGKNIRIEHLYDTVAHSRWDLENLWGIYMAKPVYTWMALWMAVTSRKKLRKRQIKYLSPNGHDHIGNIEVYNPDRLTLEEIFSEEAYLYLFDLDNCVDTEILDLTKNLDYFGKYFDLKKVEKRGVVQDCFKPSFKKKALVTIDKWQMALVNFEKIVPDKEIILKKDLMRELSGRVSFINTEVGKDYIN